MARDDLFVARLDGELTDEDRAALTRRGLTPHKIGPTTAAGQRRVPILEPLVPLLKEGFLRHGRPDGGYVVVGGRRSSELRQRARTALQAAGLDVITPHECRHTFGELLHRVGHEREGDHDAARAHVRRRDLRPIRPPLPRS